METLMDFESNADVLQFRFSYKNWLVWPLIRFFIYDEVENHVVLNIKEQHERSKRICLFWHYLVNNPFRAKKKEIIFIYGNTSNVQQPNGIYKNRLFDDYALLFPEETMMLEGNYRQEDHRLRTVGSVYPIELLNYLIKFKGKLTSAKAADTRMADNLIQLLQLQFPYQLSEKFYKDLHKIIINFSKEIKFYDKYYNYLWDKLQPNVVFVDDASYGHRWACVLKVLNTRKIHTVEIQHGWIGSNHVAYNYSNKILENKEYQSYMPEIFLGYGTYWLNQIRIPMKKEVLGYAHLSQYQAQIKSANNEILFITTKEHDSYVSLLNHMLLRLPKQYKIILKLHPVKRWKSELYNQFSDYEKDRLEIVDNCDIYQLIQHAQYVLGDASTALYEAAALGKRVFIMKNHSSLHYTSPDFGEWFETADDFIKLIQQQKNISDGKSSEYYFDSNWKQNYIKLMERLLKKDRS